MVTDALSSAGILSAFYRYKVLSTLGDQTSLVLVINLDSALDGGQQQAANLEKRIRMLAEARYQLKIHAVYWRVASLVESAPVCTVRSAPAVRSAPSAKAKSAVAQPPEFEPTRPAPRYTPRPATRSDIDDSDSGFGAPAPSDLVGLFDLPSLRG